MTLATETRLNPFPGLRSFKTKEENLFFGREKQVNELLQKLRCHRFLAVVGTSGSGKSSLVRAGLLPALHSGFMVQAGSSWRIAVLCPGNAPIYNLAKALNKPEILANNGDEEDEDTRALVIETTLERGALGLVEVVRQARLSASENLLIVVDQFEELFRFQTAPNRDDAEEKASAEEASAFVKLLLEAVKHPEISIYVVLTMRSEFLGDCAQFRDLPETINDSQFLIPRMTRDQLRFAIEGPVAVGGAKITPRLVNRLLNDMGEHPDQLPILQHALMRTWDYWMDAEPFDGLIDVQHYEAIGGVTTALSRHADEIYAGLSNDDEREIAETLFKRLTDKGPYGREIRRPSKLKEICEVTNAAQEKVIRIVDKFRAPGCSFLMPTLSEALTLETTLDISHESLMRIWDRLQNWVEEERQSAQIYRRLAESASLYEQGKTGLCINPELTIALNWLKDNHPNKAWAKRYNQHFDKASEYLEASGKAHDTEIKRQEQDKEAKLKQKEEEVREQKRINQRLKLYGASAITGLVAIGLGIFTFFQARSAVESTTNTLWQSSNVLYETRPERIDSLTYALGAKESLDWGFFNWLPFKDLTIRDQVLGKLLQSAYIVREFNRLERHNAPVNSVSFSKNDEIIASASDDRNIILWHKDNSPPQILEGHFSRVNSVSFRPDGQRIASASADGTIKIWDLSGNTLQSLSKEKQNSSVSSISYSIDGKMLASGSDDSSVTLWKDVNGKFNKPFKTLQHKDRVKAMSFSPKGKSLASVGWDGVIKIWDLNGNLIKSRDLNIRADNPKATPSGRNTQRQRLTSVSFSPDGKTIAVGSLEKLVMIWDLKDNSIKTLNAHTDRVMSVSFSHDNKYLASSSADNTVKVWKLKSQAVDMSLTVEGVTNAQFSPTGILATTELNKKIRLWKLPEIFPNSPIHNQLAPKSIITSEDNSIISMDLSPNGKITVSGEVDIKTNSSKIIFRDSQTKASLLSSNLKCGAIVNVQFSSKNSSIAAIAENCPETSRQFESARKSLIEIWDLSQRRLIASRVLENEINDFNFSEDGKEIAVVSNKSSSTHSSHITLWSWEGDKSILSVPIKDLEVSTASFRPRHKELVIGGKDGKIYLSDFKGKTNKLLEGHTDGITSLQLSSDGKTLASGSYDATIRLWNLDNKNLNRILGSHNTSITNLNFGQNKRWLASSSSDGMIKIWSLIDQQDPLLGTLQKNSNSILALKFSPDHKSLITASNSELLSWATDLNKLQKSTCQWLQDYFESSKHQNTCRR